MLIDYDKIWRVTYFSNKNKQNGVNLKSYQIPPPPFQTDHYGTWSPIVWTFYSFLLYASMIEV